MKKNVIFRNMERLLYSDSSGDNEPIEPMSVWKWEKAYKLALRFHVGSWVADGVKNYKGDFGLNIPPYLLQQFLELPCEEDDEYLSRFQLYMDRKSSLLQRYSLRSLKAYASDFINTVKNIEE